MRPMDIFDWQEFREELDRTQPTRDAVISRAFEQYRKGNDGFDEMSSAELSGAFATFRAAWILSEVVRHAQL